MTAALEFLRSPDITRLGWTLVHFLWQGAVLAAAFAAVRGALRKSSPNARYLAGCLTLLLMGVCVVGTFATLGPGERFDLPLPATAAGASGTADAPRADVAAPVLAVSPELGSRAAGAWLVVESGLPWVVGLWAVGVGLFSLRLAGGWLKVRQSRRGSYLPPDDPLCERFRELRQRLRVSRRVQLMKSALVRVPTVVGWFRPLILLPASTLSGLSPVQLDLILAHELAHLRRWDHWVNLLQLLLETVLFYHPAVWWVSRCVREDREHCCDELAVAACGNRLAFAQALTALEELRQANPAFALAATDGSLLARVRWILALPDDECGSIDRQVAGSALLALGVLVFVMGTVLYVSSPRLYTAMARVQVNPGILVPLMSVNGTTTETNAFMEAYRDFDDRRFQAAAERARLPDVLLAAVRHASGQTSTNEPPSQAEIAEMQRLNSQIHVRHIPLTRLMEIEVQAESSERATALAQAVAEEYVAQMGGGRKFRTTEAIAVFRREIAEQDKQVEELRRRVDELRTKHSIPDTVANGAAALSVGRERERLSTLLQALQQARSDLLFYQSKLKALEEMGTADSRELRDAILTVMPSEQILPLRLDDRDKVEQSLAGLRSQFAPDHPEVQRATALSAAIQAQVSNRVDAVMRGLRVNVDACQSRYELLSSQVEAAKNAVAAEASAFSKYFEAKRELESRSRIRDAVSTRLVQEAIDAQVTAVTLAEVLESAGIIRGPWRRSEPYDLWLMGSGLFMTLSGLVVRSRPKLGDEPKTAVKAD